jgi:hypothetical protein
MIIKTKKIKKITQFYIKVCSFQKWTFLECPNPKKFSNYFLLFFAPLKINFILL